MSDDTCLRKLGCTAPKSFHEREALQASWEQKPMAHIKFSDWIKTLQNE